MTDEEKTISMEQNDNCFVIMPIFDLDGYEPGYFKCAYEDIFIPVMITIGT